MISSQAAKSQDDEKHVEELMGESSPHLCMGRQSFINVS
jgi:hypothetical protein